VEASGARSVPSTGKQYARLLELYKAMLSRARDAIYCWGMAGRRLGVAKDMRVLIGLMAWEEAWRWGEKNEEESK
jgi:hypothetical protein